MKRLRLPGRGKSEQEPRQDPAMRVAGSQAFAYLAFLYIPGCMLRERAAYSWVRSLHLLLIRQFPSSMLGDQPNGDKHPIESF